MTKKEKKPKRSELHRQILERARISPDIISVSTTKQTSSDANTVGRASAKLFNSISNRRQYDSYCRPIKGKADDSNITNSRKVFQQITDIRPAHRPLHEIRAEAARKVDEIRRQQDGGASTMQTSAIGFEPSTFGPPGMRPPINGVSRSHGNERCFSAYDGEWENGLPDGRGGYTTANGGGSFVGQFRKGQPHGQGRTSCNDKASSPNNHDGDDGTIYEGDYRSGLPHGIGKCRYRGGVTYDGDWKAGRRDGFGTIKYPNQSTYVGGFRRGQMHGHGTFASTTIGIEYSGKFSNGYVSGEGCLTLDGATIIRNWPKEDRTGSRSARLTVIEAIEVLMKDDTGADRL